MKLADPSVDGDGGWLVALSDGSGPPETHTTASLVDMIGVRWLTHKHSEENEQEAKKRMKVETANAEQKKRMEVQEAARVHFKTVEKETQIKLKLTDEEWAECREVLCNKKPYVDQGYVVAAVPGGWKQVVMRDLVRSKMAEPLNVVAKQQEEILEEKKITNQLKRKHNELLGKKVKKPTTMNTRMGCVITGPQLDITRDNRKHNAQIDEDNRKEAARKAKRRKKVKFDEVVECESRIKSKKKLTMKQQQATLEAAFHINPKKTSADITKEIYGPSKATKKAGDVSELWTLYVSQKGGIDHIPWKDLKEVYEEDSAEEEESVLQVIYEFEAEACTGYEDREDLLNNDDIMESEDPEAADANNIMRSEDEDDVSAMEEDENDSPQSY